MITVPSSDLDPNETTYPLNTYIPGVYVFAIVGTLNRGGGRPSIQNVGLLLFIVYGTASKNMHL